jgi:hypothetical protein
MSYFQPLSFGERMGERWPVAIELEDGVGMSLSKNKVLVPLQDLTRATRRLKSCVRCCTAPHIQATLSCRLCGMIR